LEDVDENKITFTNVGVTLISSTGWTPGTSETNNPKTTTPP
jgi:hypothetical protein